MNSTYYLLYSILQLGYFISVIGSALERQYIVCWTKTAANRTWPHVLRMALAAETLIRRPWCLLFSVEIWYNYRLQVTIFDWNRLAIVNVIFTLLRGNFNRLSLFPMETRIFSTFGYYADVTNFCQLLTKDIWRTDLGIHPVEHTIGILLPAA